MITTTLLFVLESTALEPRYFRGDSSSDSQATTDSEDVYVSTDAADVTESLGLQNIFNQLPSFLLKEAEEDSCYKDCFLDEHYHYNCSGFCSSCRLYDSRWVCMHASSL